MSKSEQVTLRDIYDVVNRIEDKFDQRIRCVEDDVEVLKTFRDNMMGKIAIITVIATSVVSIIIAFIKDILSRKI